MKPGVFQGKKFPFTPKRRKKSLGSQYNSIIDTRHDLAAFRSKLANVSWLRSYILGSQPSQFTRLTQSISYTKAANYSQNTANKPRRDVKHAAMQGISGREDSSWAGKTADAVGMSSHTSSSACLLHRGTTPMQRP